MQGGHADGGTWRQPRAHELRATVAAVRLRHRYVLALAGMLSGPRSGVQRCWPGCWRGLHRTDRSRGAWCPADGLRGCRPGLVRRAGLAARTSARAAPSCRSTRQPKPRCLRRRSPCRCRRRCVPAIHSVRRRSSRAAPAPRADRRRGSAVAAVLALQRARALPSGCRPGGRKRQRWHQSGWWPGVGLPGRQRHRAQPRTNSVTSGSHRAGGSSGHAPRRRSRRRRAACRPNRSARPA